MLPNISLVLLLEICLFILVLSASFVSHCLNLFPTTLILKHKRMKNWVHNLFILGMSQWRSQWIKYTSLFFLQSSGDCPHNWTKGSIDSDMFISTGVLVFLQGFVVCVVVGRSPSNLYPFMDADFCSLNLCFISWGWTKGSGNVPGLVFTDGFANNFACSPPPLPFIMTGTAQGASVTGRKTPIVKIYTPDGLEKEKDFLHRPLHKTWNLSLS